jgi:hypothetical protein
MTSKQLNDAWVLLRLNLRDISRDYVSNHKKAVEGLPLEPTDPERIAPMVKSMASELDRMAGGSEKSPVLRKIKKAFLPNDYEKSRRRIVKSFNVYLKAWAADNSGS